MAAVKNNNTTNVIISNFRSELTCSCKSDDFPFGGKFSGVFILPGWVEAVGRLISNGLQNWIHRRVGLAVFDHIRG